MDTIQSSGGSPANTSVPASIKVLAAEDDRFLASAYSAKLRKVGFEVLLARDGQEALEILKTERPDVIILDIRMPRLDGFATLEAIRQQPQLKSIPVFVASNSDTQEDRERSISLGATDYIVKSNLSLNDLVAKIRTAAQQASGA